MNNYYYIFLVLVCVVLLIVFFMKGKSGSAEMVVLNDKNNKLKERYHGGVKQFERKLSNWYPLGDDQFRIDHGQNYFAFFERLGEMNFGVCTVKNKVVGTACAVRRQINKDIVWYLCDLKIDKEHRGLRMPYKMLTTLGPKVGLKGKIYGVSMNSGQDNRVLKLAKNIPIINFKSNGNLLIFSLDYDSMVKAVPTIIRYRGNISFITLSGIKDLILKSTMKPKKICHIQWAPCGQFVGCACEPQKDHDHMFCCPENDPMAHDLNSNGITTDITATIISANMGGCDWRFILTSDI